MVLICHRNILANSSDFIAYVLNDLFAGVSDVTLKNIGSIVKY